ncbi:MAG TPA: hypothetical protein DD391_05810 [Clostridiales bacterium]|nr:LysM peptidoglycan-binding domain-containing protein [Clostridiales bacterium]HBL82100.1 hypothetical protein [Clostridiales bacterium]
MIQNTERAQTTKVIQVPKKYYSANESMGAKDKNGTNRTEIQKGNWIFNRKKLKIFAGTTAAIAGTAVACAVVASSFSLGYTVKVDNTVVGTVAAKSEFYEVLDEVKTEVKDIADVEFEPSGKESFQVELIKKDSFTEKEELAENLKSTSEEMTEGFSITYDGVYFAALSTQEDAERLLEQYLAGFTAGNENVTAEFAQEVKITPTHVVKDTVKTADSVYAELLAGKFVSYEVQDGESLEDIAANFDTTAESILADNQLAEQTSLAGQTLKIYTGEPVLSVKTVEHVNGEFEIPFETISNEDDTLYQGKTEVDTEGVNGLKFVDSYITKIDGVTVEETVMKNDILKEPVTQVERVGTKELPPSVGTGEFAVPTSGTLTSPFGARWGRMHAGIDLGASTGTPIYASDNGIVTEAQFKNNGYGNFISIDHGNGFVTYYAHCSEILVSPGDVVAKGDLIARVGSTGRSTGPHLHFEVRADGEAQDPMNYIK